MLGAEVELKSTLTKTILPLGQIRNLKAGDIIPVEIPDEIIAVVEEVPIFKGVFGKSNGQCSIKITDYARNDEDD